MYHSFSYIFFILTSSCLLQTQDRDAYWSEQRKMKSLTMELRCYTDVHSAYAEGSLTSEVKSKAVRLETI